MQVSKNENDKNDRCFDVILKKTISLTIRNFKKKYLWERQGKALKLKRKNVIEAEIDEIKDLDTIRYPAGIYLLKVNNRNTRTRCGICSKLTINNGVVLVSWLLTLDIFHTLF